jgi:NitT/TauT family transport system ATP-binding protein
VAVAAAAVVLRDVTKHFVAGRRPVPAVDGITLDIADGEFFCIVGPSGCGKTTLLRILAGLETPTGGTMTLAGNGRSQSMVFQQESIFPWMTVRDNVAFGLRAQGVSRRMRHASARALIATVRLSGFERAYPHQLSGGMKQRVALARALATDPAVLLMDEPFGALDEQTRLLLQAELLRVWEATRKTVVFVTHNIDEAVLLGDRIAVMTARPGRISEIVDVSAVFPRPRQVAKVRGNPHYGDLFARIWSRLLAELEPGLDT